MTRALVPSLGRTLVAALLAMTLPAAVAGDGLLQRDDKPEFLKVDEAFELQPLYWREDGVVEVSWRIARDYYLYRGKLKFAAADPESLQLGRPALPPSLPHEDEHFGRVEIYRDDVFVRIPLLRPPKGRVRITVTYQGCADAGLCYPPQTRTLEATR